MALRVVGKEAPPASTQTVAPQTVAEAAKSKNQRDLLVAMRDRIADAVTRADCAPRDLASLTKRLQDIVRDIATLDAIAAAERKTSGANAPVDNTFDASAI